MKKIILVFTLLVNYFGFTQQVLITNFETSPDLASWDGAAVIQGSDPQSGGTRGMNMKMDVTVGVGQFWQGVKVTLASDNLMNLTTDKTVKVDIYSTTPRTVMAKVESASGAPASADDENHGGTGWETITFTFTTGADATQTANGNYNVLAVFANRNGSGGWTNPWASSTIYFDNLTAVKFIPAAQLDLITNFETSPDLASWDGAAVIQGSDPQSGGTRGMNMKMDVTAGAGQFWQGAKVTFANNNLMNLSTNKTVKVDIYSTTQRTIMAKVESGSGAPASADDENHGGTGWETITFTFTTGADATQTANGNYNVIAFFANRNGSGAWTNPWATTTTYFDNVYAVKYVAPADPAPTVSAPNPTHGNADVVMSMFNDKPGYTNAYGPDGDFGTRTLVNLDAELDQTIKMNFGIAGWGQYDNSPPSVATANFLHLSYYVPTFAAGSGGHGFWIMLNSGSGEKQYRIGNGNTPNSQNSPIVFDSWQTVSIPMSHFTGQGFNPATLLSWKLGSDSDLNTKFVYFDNIFFTTQALNNDSFSKNTVSIYPNPVQDILTINALDTINSVEIFNINGQKMAARLNNNTVDVSNLSSGVYLLNVELSNGSKEVVKFVK